MIGGSGPHVTSCWRLAQLFCGHVTSSPTGWGLGRIFKKNCRSLESWIDDNLFNIKTTPSTTTRTPAGIFLCLAERARFRPPPPLPFKTFSVPSKEEEEKKWRVPSSGDFGAPKSDWRAPKSIPAECGRGVSDKRPQRNTFCPFENVSTCRHFDAIRSPPATRNRHRHVIYGLRVLARWLALWSSPPGGTCGVWNVKCPSIHQVHPPGVHFSRINK